MNQETETFSKANLGLRVRVNFLSDQPVRFEAGVIFGKVNP